MKSIYSLLVKQNKGLSFFKSFIKKPFCISNLLNKITYTDKEISLNKSYYISKIITSIDKGNSKNAIAEFKSLKQDKLLLTIDDINNILTEAFSRKTTLNQIELFNELQNYIIDKQIIMNILTVNILMSISLEYKGFNSAYNILVEASLLNTPVDLSSLMSLYLKLQQVENIKVKQKCKAFISGYILKKYGKEIRDKVVKLVYFGSVFSRKNKQLKEDLRIKLNKSLKKSEKIKQKIAKRKDLRKEKKLQGNNNQSENKTMKPKSEKKKKGEKDKKAINQVKSKDINKENEIDKTFNSTSIEKKEAFNKEITKDSPTNPDEDK